VSYHLALRNCQTRLISRPLRYHAQMDNEQDFCADCGKAIWQHGVQSVSIGDKSYCTQCADKQDAPPSSSPASDFLRPSSGPPPLPPAYVAKFAAAPTPTPAAPEEINSDFCNRCGAEIYRQGQSCIEVAGGFYCENCAPNIESETGQRRS
jgi:hypothetical protein